jgi:hypothetical protein
MAELGIAEYFNVREALNNCYILCDFVFLQKANAESISRCPNKGSQ